MTRETSPEKKRIPKFNNENEEFEFWQINDPDEYINEFKETDIVFEPSERLVKLMSARKKGKKERISIMLNPDLKSDLEFFAGSKGIGYQVLIQMILNEWVKNEVLNLGNQRL
ncbi:MAG: hypothetical protein K8T10_09710 [Candidatus Eremiobacteraeota bacterium]|nr:hypothetical protein [Candidatus Eremiobacteraeota bacterium]